MHVHHVSPGLVPARGPGQGSHKRNVKFQLSRVVEGTRVWRERGRSRAGAGDGPVLGREHAGCPACGGQGQGGPSGRGRQVTRHSIGPGNDEGGQDSRTPRGGDRPGHYLLTSQIWGLRTRQASRGSLNLGRPQCHLPHKGPERHSKSDGPQAQECVSSETEEGGGLTPR